MPERMHSFPQQTVPNKTFFCFSGCVPEEVCHVQAKKNLFFLSQTFNQFCQYVREAHKIIFKVVTGVKKLMARMVLMMMMILCRKTLRLQFRVCSCTAFKQTF